MILLPGTVVGRAFTKPARHNVLDRTGRYARS